MFTISLALSLVAAELILRWLHPSEGTSDIVEHDDLLGYRHKKSAHSSFRSGDRRVSIRINADGLRQDEEVRPKEENEIRVLALGDSFGFGWGVNYEESFVSRIQEKARETFPDWKINILNAGHGGWGTQQMLAYLENRGFDYSPDMVVTFMGPQDVEDNDAVPLYRLNLDKTLTEKPILQTSWGNRSRLANWLPAYQWLLFNSYLVQMARIPVLQGMNELRSFIGNLHRPKEIKPPPIPGLIFQFMYRKTDDIEHLTRALFRRMIADCAKRNIPFTVADVGQASERTLAFIRMKPNFFVDEKVDFIDSIPALAEELAQPNSPLFLKGDNHYSPLGHERFTHYVWPHLKERIQRVIDAKRSQRKRLATR